MGLSRADLRAVTVFAGAGRGVEPQHANAVADLGRHLAHRGITVVYGGDNLGLMKVLADATLEAGGRVHGVIPATLAERTGGHPGLTVLDVVADMHERKARMAALGDAFIAVPGGVGTLEELFEAWAWSTLGLHAKPVVLFDVADFWTPLNQLLDHLVASGFLSAIRRATLLSATAPDELVELLGR